MQAGFIINRVGPAAPFRWLSKGFRDFYMAAGPGVAYGMVFVSLGIVIASVLYMSGDDAWLPALWGGFLILAPVLATGLYCTAREIEAGRPVRFVDMIFPRTASPFQLFLFGVLLFLLFWSWLNAADQIAWIIGQEARSGLDIFIEYIMNTGSGKGLALLGIIYGGGLAALAYLIGAISVPLMVDKPVSVLKAIWVNLCVLYCNPLPMLIWAVIIIVLTVIGLATAFLWFLVTFPLLGFASWHAYRELVVFSPTNDALSEQT